ncbi:MAG: PIG-L family deacetylase [Thermoflavifilum sp.]|nr:PIG-L family deacetylase [Thermoflavifilum sp.]MCL6514828.1 PIG-L family deacetylase [Alicyclobacillus sp.]
MSLFDLYPVPDLWQARRILCIQPHPDDMDVACGGTLARLADAGAEITLLTVTDGGAGTMVPRDPQELARIRRAEQEAAGKHIGVKAYRWLDYPDAELLPEAPLQHDLIRAIREMRPDTVFTVDPWLPYEAHPAHRTVGLVAASAVLFANMPNIGPAPSDDAPPHSPTRIVFAFTARPNTFVDVSGVWERRLAAVRAHQSQFPEPIWPFYEAYLTQKARDLGPRANAELAEGIKVLAPIHLHCNLDAEHM